MPSTAWLHRQHGRSAESSMCLITADVVSIFRPAVSPAVHAFQVLAAAACSLLVGNWYLRACQWHAMLHARVSAFKCTEVRCATTQAPGRPRAPGGRGPRDHRHFVHDRGGVDWRRVRAHTLRATMFAPSLLVAMHSLRACTAGRSQAARSHGHPLSPRVRALSILSSPCASGGLPARTPCARSQRRASGRAGAAGTTAWPTSTPRRSRR